MNVLVVRSQFLHSVFDLPAALGHHQGEGGGEGGPLEGCRETPAVRQDTEEPAMSLCPLNTSLEAREAALNSQGKTPASAPGPATLITCLGADRVGHVRSSPDSFPQL